MREAFDGTVCDFFYQKSPGIALVDIAILLLFIGLTVHAFWQQSRFALLKQLLVETSRLNKADRSEAIGLLQAVLH